MRFASSVVVLVPIMTVAPVFNREAQFEPGQSPETQVTPLFDEIDKAPDKLPRVPSVSLNDPVNVPSELIVSFSIPNELTGPADKT